MNASKSIKKGLTAAVIVATALFAPGAQAQELRRIDPELGRQIAEQGNRAVAQVLAQNREAVKHLSPIAPRDYAVVPVTLKLAKERGQTPFLRKGVQS